MMAMKRYMAENVNSNSTYTVCLSHLGYLGLHWLTTTWGSDITHQFRLIVLYHTHQSLLTSFLLSIM